MVTKNLSKLKEAVKQIISVKDVEISKLKEENKILGFKTPHFHFSDIVWPQKIKAEIQNHQKDISINNLPKEQKISGEVEVKNFPKEFKVEVKNHPKLQEVEIKNWPKQKEIEKPSWISEVVDMLTIKLTMGITSIITTTFSTFGKFLIKLWASGIEIKTAKPLFVIPVDENGKVIDFNKPVRVNVNAFAGGSSSRATLAPLDGYKVADTDDANNVKYYGFIDSIGQWYILKEDTSAGTYRYTKGGSLYPVAWTDRTNKTYDYFNVIFPNI